jgi:hypothetical protein
VLSSIELGLFFHFSFELAGGNLRQAKAQRGENTAGYAFRLLISQKIA